MTLTKEKGLISERYISSLRKEIPSGVSYSMLAEYSEGQLTANQLNNFFSFRVKKVSVKIKYVKNIKAAIAAIEKKVKREVA
jgi:hypothetical protein